MQGFSIHTLGSGGVIANYRCTAACRHCLYGCSPRWPDEYIGEAAARRVCQALAQRGCTSVHIGGGEPFLHFEELLMLVREIGRAGMELEYIETNASWCTDDGAVREKLVRLLDAGAACVMASTDPFHSEFVPLERPLRLVEQCRRAGMDYFVWKQGFIPRLAGLDPASAHSREALAKHLGRDYIACTAREYGLRFHGRALNIEREHARVFETVILLRDDRPCRELAGVNHYHADLYGRFVPPGCTGIGIALEDLEQITPEKYPVACALYHGGISALYAYAKQRGYEPQPAYTGRCALCYDMRRHLAAAAPTADLSPADFYRQDY